MQSTERYAWGAAFVFGVMTSACQRTSLPDPRVAAERYAAAVASGDADAVRALLTTRAQSEWSRDDVQHALKSDRAELTERAKRVAAPGSRVEMVARLRFDDGEQAELVFREGRFGVTSAGTLPGGSRTPVLALDQLRRVLARRNDAGLLRILTPKTRAAMEQDLRSLVKGLERPETLPIDVHDDSAVVAVPGGHSVKLRRNGGVWHVDDFD
jgi:hypothetical protein